MDRNTQTTIGIVFLALMVIFIVLAVTTFKGDATILLVVGAILFLAVGLALFLGGGSGDDEGQSQQQSVTLADGQVLTQGFGGAAQVCRSCNSRAPGRFAFCPSCGAKA